MMEVLFFSFSFLSVVLLTHLLPPLVYTFLHQFLRRLLFLFFLSVTTFSAPFVHAASLVRNGIKSSVIICRLA